MLFSDKIDVATMKKSVLEAWVSGIIPKVNGCYILNSMVEKGLVLFSIIYSEE